MFRKVILLALVGVALSAPSNTVTSQLSAALAAEGKANIVISFKGDTSAVLGRANSIRFATRGAKATFVKAELEQLQSSAQKNALRLLSAGSINFRSSWMTNRIFIRDATPELVSALASLPDVTEIREEIISTIVENIPSTNGRIAAEWGVEQVQAPEVWAAGVNGTGAVIAVVDTGIRGTHERLRGSKRASYDWFDPIYNTQVPTDHMGHGTHCTGSIAGQDGIGVAPGAKWIGCVGCNAQGMCPEADVVSCGEWVFCPSLPDGSNPNCNQLADAVSNSWGKLGTQHNFLDSVIDSFHTVGIIPIYAAGNDYSCQSIRYPGYHPQVIAVGATDDTDDLAYFSSKGPAANNLIKPEISAPGVDVISASSRSDTALESMSGTSMATPHLAGVVALLRSQNKVIGFNQIKAVLGNTAERDLPEVSRCGTTPPNQYPNNMFGHGRVNAFAAFNNATVV